MFLRSSSSEHASDFTHLATSEMTGTVFIGLLSHMTPLETVPFSPPLISFRSFGDDKLSQIVVNQLVRTEIKFTQSVGYRQSLCAFISSQSKRCRTIHTLMFHTLIISYPTGVVYLAQVDGNARI